MRTLCLTRRPGSEFCTDPLESHCQINLHPAPYITQLVEGVDGEHTPAEARQAGIALKNVLYQIDRLRSFAVEGKVLVLAFGNDVHIGGHLTPLQFSNAVGVAKILEKIERFAGDFLESGVTFGITIAADFEVRSGELATA